MARWVHRRCPNGATLTIPETIAVVEPCDTLEERLANCHLVATSPRMFSMLGEVRGELIDLVEMAVEELRAQAIPVEPPASTYIPVVERIDLVLAQAMGKTS